MYSSYTRMSPVDATRGIHRRTFPPLPPSLVHSSSIPSPVEETTIRETIRDIDTTLSSVDDEIARVRATLSELEEYRGTLRTALQHQQAPLSPIRRLPPEILGEVFLFASAGCVIEWPRSPRKSFAVNQDDDDVPWLLCEICSYWRTVAISFPKLWSNMRLDLTLPSLLGIEAAQSFLSLCLSRSKNELLTFSLNAREFKSTTLLPLLEPLLAHSERWKDVSLNGVVFSDLQDHLARARNRMPNLQRLSIERLRSVDSVEDLPLSWSMDIFENTRNLCELSLKYIIHPFHNFRILWSQITHFSSKGSTFREGEFTLLMRHMTNLISFSTEGERILEVASTQPVLLQHLRKLSIHNKAGYISKTCQFLTVPNLEELSIRTVTPFVAQHITVMIARSQCKPTRLIFHSSLDADQAWDENVEVAWMLCELPSLNHLELTIAKSVQHILPLLGKPLQSAAPPPLPNLACLVLEDRLCTSAVEITEALSWRIMKGVPPSLLRSITLRLFPPATSKFSELDLLKGIARFYGVEITTFSG